MRYAARVYAVELRRTRPPRLPSRAARGRAAVKLTLIRPNLGDYRSSDAMPPLAMGILAARARRMGRRLLRREGRAAAQGRPARSSRAQRRDLHRAPCLRGGRCVPRARRAGGHGRLSPDASCPTRRSQHADAVVIGDAEGVWERVLEDFQGGRLAAALYWAATGRTAARLSPGSLHLPRQALRTGGARAVRSRLPLRLRLLLDPRFYGTSVRVRRSRRTGSRDRAPAREAAGVLRRRQPVRRTRPSSLALLDALRAAEAPLVVPDQHRRRARRALLDRLAEAGCASC